MTSVQLSCELLVLDAPPWHNLPELKMTAKRYTTSFADSRGLTLLFAHGVSTHKEHWEPMLCHLFLCQKSEQPHRRIREAWCFDWPNHGDAAIINKVALERRPSEHVSAAEWAAAIASFVRPLYVRGHRLVGLGHSAGGSAIMLSTQAFPLYKQPFVALFLIDPSMLTRKLWESHLLEEETRLRRRVSAALRRQHLFSTREEAAGYFRRRNPWKAFDLDVFNIFIQHGLHVVTQNDSGNEIKLALKCDGRCEAYAYQDIESHFEATDQYTHICRVVSVHIVFGSEHDYLPSYFQDCVTDVSQGRNPASVTRIPEVGHMIVQQAPKALASAISVGLNSISRDSVSHSLHRL